METIVEKTVEETSNETNNVVTLNTSDNLNKLLLKVLDEELTNKKLIKHLNDVFSKKGMNKLTVAGLFNGGRSLETLSNMQLMAFIQGCYDILEWDALNPEKIFSDRDISAYEGYIVEEKLIDTMHFKYCRKIDDDNYECYVPYEDLYLWYSNTLITYNADSQRAPRLKQTGKANSLRKQIYLKDKNVQDIANEMESGDYEEDMIIFNIRMIRGAIPNFKFIPIITDKDENGNDVDIIGDIDITPNYERKSKSQTVCECIDGWHRLSGLAKAIGQYRQHGGVGYIKGGLFVKIVMRDMERAKKIVRQTFLRTQTDLKWIEALKEDDYTKFADELVKKSRHFKDKVSTDFESCLVSGTLTYKLVIAETIQKCCSEIPVNSRSEVKWITDDLARIIDEIVDWLISMYYPTTEMLKEDSVLLDKNMIVGYIAMANTIRNMEEEFDNFDKLADRLYLINKKDSMALHLNDKSYSATKIYDYFVNIVKEIM